MIDATAPLPRRRRPFRWGLVLLLLGTLPWTGLLIWAFLEDRYSATWSSALQLGLVWAIGVALMAILIFPFVYLLSWLIGRFGPRTP